MDLSVCLKQYYQGFDSERLLFRKLTPDDIVSWEAFYINNPNLKYLDVQFFDDIRIMATRWIEAQLRRYENNEFGQLAITLKEDHTLIGTRGFRYSDYQGERILNLMGSIIPAFWRKGYGIESAKCFANFIFDNKVAQKLISTTHEHNTGSQKMLEKTGFRKIDFLKTSDRNVCIFSLTNEHWKLWKSK